MAQTQLHNYTVQEKLNKMDVDLIKSTPDIGASTYQTGDLMAENESISNAVAVNGGTCILQSITAIDTSDTGGSIYVVITDVESDLGSIGSAPSAADAHADNSIAIVELSNWVDIGGAKVCTKGNIGLVCKADTESKVLYYHVINTSGGNIVIGSDEDIIFQFGVVKD